jgi:hypothetical protein
MAKDKEPRIDAKLKRAPAEQQEELWELRNPSDEDAKPLSFVELQLEVPRVCGFTVSSGALSEWLAWYRLQRRMKAAAERADQTRLELLKDASLKPEDIERVAQAVFTAETFETGDVKAYVALARLRLEATRQELEREKITAAGKSKIEAGLDALLAEIQGNPKALRLFNDLKEVVSKA